LAAALAGSDGIAQGRARSIDVIALHAMSSPASGSALWPVHCLATYQPAFAFGPLWRSATRRSHCSLHRGSCRQSRLTAHATCRCVASGPMLRTEASVGSRSVSRRWSPTFNPFRMLSAVLHISDGFLGGLRELERRPGRVMPTRCRRPSLML
jgi:hypothetical protein